MKSRVLIVDDDAAIVDGLTTLLQMEDIESAGACDRLSAQAMIKGTFYPIIIADVRLHTEQQGLELLDDIRSLSPRSRVISLTGFATPELERELRLRGSKSVISKPSSAAEIIDAIDALLAEAATMNTDRLQTRVLDLKNRFVRSLPDRIAAIAETLRSRKTSTEGEGALDRHFHNLAGTAGTFGLFAIAAAAIDGYDECFYLDGALIEGDARYLWSIVEELENEVYGRLRLDPATETTFNTVIGVCLDAAH